MRLTYRNYRIALNCNLTFSLIDGVYTVVTQGWRFLIWNNQGLLLWDSYQETGVELGSFAGAVQQALGQVDSLVEGDFVEPEVVAIASPF